MVFTMLCLTTFGILSLGTALAETRLTEKNAGSVTSYYACQSRSQEILAEIDGILKSGQMQGKTADEMLQEIRGINGVTVEDQLTPKVIVVSVSDGGPIGVQMELVISPEGAIRVISSKMTSDSNFVYGTEKQDLWKG